ncbi:thiaminase II [Olleya namhaensis]|uniref:Aminopyrimidine aminohydrolase n=1 Tax=Olleya namhaensis TaxID=1144750 RepID=A0A1I3SQB7_9FLAO|nr:thiaminase II [Olleya namhaensis]SFJ60580.1 thiaminase /4-amino-5-aminomethyl-2-methylpyrimidine deaminase [Olleya namhaensis]
MSNWYNQVNHKTAPILEAIKQQPFIKQLMDGTLPQSVFEFYINQDALYLAEYKKNLATIGVKCSDSNETQFFLDAATGIIAVENALHHVFMKSVTFNNVPSPTCELYTSYLTRIINNQTLEEGLAAILPCFTIYKAIGDYILEHQTNKQNNPYQDWINTYGGAAFEASVNQAIAIVNKYAESANKDVLHKMEVTFTKASKLEWLFWDSAYNKEQWKI